MTKNEIRKRTHSTLGLPQEAADIMDGFAEALGISRSKLMFCLAMELPEKWPDEDSLWDWYRSRMNSDAVWDSYKETAQKAILRNIEK